MMMLNKWTLPSYGNLYTGRTPLDHISQSFLFYSLKTFMDLARINISLNDVHYGNIKPFFSLSRYHHILSLKKSSHYVRYGCLFYSGGYLFHSDWSVSCYEKMTLQARNK